MEQNGVRERILPGGLPPLIRRQYTNGVLTSTTSDTWATTRLSSPRQRTESFRTDPKKWKTAEDILVDEAAEFVDVTRNGFTEPNPQYDNGHEFFTSKTSIQVSHRNWDFTWVDPRYPPWSYRQKGPLFINVPNGDPNNPGGVPFFWPLEQTKLSASETNVLGSRLIAATLPNKGPASLAAFLGELHEGLPKLIGLGLLKDRESFSRAVGGEFLNYTFGIAPLVSDIQKLMKTVIHTSKTVQQYHRDSGRNVRRRLSLPPRETVEVEENVPLGASYMPGLYGWDKGSLSSSGAVNLTKTTSSRTWFSGAYAYTVTNGDDIVSRFMRFEEDANRVLGSRITAETLWQLTPWSWLLDWVTNIGDLITNVTYLGSDGLVLRYGYLMNHVKVRSVYSMPSGATFTGGAKTGPISNTLSCESKERVRATPYGFGTSLGQLSAKQWAILGALGLTRAPGVLV